jgi:hypothetical protein
MGREQWSDEECRLWSDLRGPRFSVNLRGAEHLTTSDAVWLAKGAIKTGTTGPEKTTAVMRDRDYTLMRYPPVRSHTNAGENLWRAAIRCLQELLAFYQEELRKIHSQQ